MKTISLLRLASSLCSGLAVAAGAVVCPEDDSPHRELYGDLHWTGRVQADADGALSATIQADAAHGGKGAPNVTIAGRVGDDAVTMVCRDDYIYYFNWVGDRSDWYADKTCRVPARVAGPVQDGDLFQLWNEV